MDVAKAAKYGLDRFFAMLLLVALGPLVLGLALAIRLESPGSPLALEERIGERGRSFTVCRFRTARREREKDRSAVRPTGLGRFLRRTRLEGLPVLLNVLLGEMSFVGPRPINRQEADACTPRQARRFSFRPGITGWAQVHGARGRTDEMDLDVHYVERYSLGLDLRTLCRTLLPAAQALRQTGTLAPISPAAEVSAALDATQAPSPAANPLAATAATAVPGAAAQGAVKEPEDDTSILVIGASGRARVVIDAIEKQARYVIAGLVDDRPERTRGHLMDYPVLGGREALEHPGVPRRAAIAVGSPRAREAWFVHLENLGFELPTIVHPSAQVGREVEIGPGTVLLPGAIVNSGTRLGRGVVVESAASVDHDCDLGDFVVVGTGAHLAGGVQVGPRTLIGIGTSIMHALEIGPEVLIGASAAVVEPVPAGATVVGVPARLVRRADEARPEPATLGRGRA